MKLTQFRDDRSRLFNEQRKQSDYSQSDQKEPDIILEVRRTPKRDVRNKVDESANLIKQIEAIAGRIIFSMFKDDEDRHDALQDVVERVLKIRSSEKYESPANFKAWLYRVASNVCVDAYRKKKHYKLDTFSYQDLEDLDRMLLNSHLNAWKTETSILDEATKTVLNDRLETLADDDRLLLTLSCFFDYSGYEIAAGHPKFGTPQNVNRRLRKIKKRFREDLEREGIALGTDWGGN